MTVLELQAELGRLFAAAYLCDTETKRQENIREQQAIKAALRIMLEGKHV